MVGGERLVCGSTLILDDEGPLAAELVLGEAVVVEELL